MDAVTEIKARLPIEELVAQYTQLTKKGRNFVALCPFHHDKNPSFLVSPDKGIAYCFPCQKGGDIFSFYQAVEGVDFKQALKDLADKTGVKLENEPKTSITKDERERLRDCLEAALLFFQATLKASKPTLEYLQKRGVPGDQIERFELGMAPDSFSATYEHLLKAGFSKNETVAAGLAVRKDLSDERMYDRFRNRLMFPIRDIQGRIIGFGGRTLGTDDAKYLNSSETILYHKSGVLYGVNEAKEAMRQKKNVIVVEGYFDVLACHRNNAAHTVATCGTALTPDHAKILKRYTETVTLCLDSDRAGREAAERAFQVLSHEGLQVYGITMSEKDPADMAQEAPETLSQILAAGGKPYLEVVLDEIRVLDLQSPRIRVEALRRLLPLLQALPTAVERTHYIRAAADVLGTTQTALEEDLEAARKQDVTVTSAPAKAPEALLNATLFSSVELTLALFIIYPRHRGLLKEVIPPEDEQLLALYNILKDAPPEAQLEDLPLSLEHRERVAIILLYCEEQGLTQWNDSIALREIRANTVNSNRDFIRRKQVEITSQMLAARKAGQTTEEDLLKTQYQQLLKLSKMAS